MDIFEYLPQLIVAYDGNDEFANLIHVTKANKDINYICPCCGGIVKPRALNSLKEQSHYYHITGKCTKESQLHFFCKNWLFDKGSKFYINNDLYEVDTIEVEKPYNTPFGKYVPDVTVHTTTGKDIYFEMFFTNRKTGDDYFCKWDYLGNDVIEVNIKEYMFKTDKYSIPSFSYLYHDGVCYSKPYIKRDLYANTIAVIKRELTRQKVLNYKARIEQLDWFWQEIRNNKPKEELLETLSQMEYDDMVSCYEIIKRKQCVLYLKNDVLDLINRKVISDIRNSLDLPHDENIYFDLDRVRGRTYKAGIRLNIKTEHISHDKLYSPSNYLCSFGNYKGFPKIVFNKNILSVDQIQFNEKDIGELKELYDEVVLLKDTIISYEAKIVNFEKDQYKIRVNNDTVTVLIKSPENNYEVLIDNHRLNDYSIDALKSIIENEIVNRNNQVFLDQLFQSNEYISFVNETKKYDQINIEIMIHKYSKNYKNGIRFTMYIANRMVYDNELSCNFRDFNEQSSKCKTIIYNFIDTYSTVMDLIYKINTCKNNFWKSEFYFDYFGYPTVKIDQNYFVPRNHFTVEKISLYCFDSLTQQDIVKLLESGMKNVLKNMEYCGYRVMEVD